MQKTTRRTMNKVKLNEETINDLCFIIGSLVVFMDGTTANPCIIAVVEGSYGVVDFKDGLCYISGKDWDAFIKSVRSNCRALKGSVTVTVE
jgi:hypothetical protein